MISGDNTQSLTLYILTGLPFSGKSTLAKKLSEALQLSNQHSLMRTLQRPLSGFVKSAGVID